MKRRVVVVGGGAAGTAVAARLLGCRVDVVLVESADRPGGVAYSTSDERHLLNVPAGRMGADEEDPDGFVRWLRHRRPVEPGDFVPRGQFGRYLEDYLRACGDAAPGRLRRVRDRAVSVDADRTVRLAGGRALTGDAVVLAIGTHPPGTSWVPPDLTGLVPDPWAPGALEAVPDDEDVLLVGTGLTMVDVAITLARAGRVVHAVSRRGLLPRVHRPGTPVVPWEPSATTELSSLRAELGAHLRDAVLRQGDWRGAFDGLRPHTALVWGRLSEEDKDAFLAEDVRAWDVRRHRLPPATAGELTRLRRAGLVRVGRGSVGSFSGGVTLTDGTRLPVGAVVNCTGAEADLRRVADPLVRSLLDRGLARPGPAGLGFDTAADGAVRGAVPGLWTLGAPRRGNLWETTAFPEIRAQARGLAGAVTRYLTEHNHPHPIRELAS
ncbi:FAD/NAD(P)-binding protein [Amycolatopsis sp. NPDC047767]|uniref:FAD/NAD(P)-binding protein n=1 Tax=Amycolatopsis sp. NPDC047767 TaxID=3156765 RepID=UPI003456E570